jgi:hypothetical protein
LGSILTVAVMPEKRIVPFGTSTSLIRTGMIEPVQEQSLRRHVGGFFSVHIGEKIPLRLPKRRAQRYPWETEAEIERRYP